MSAAPDAAGAIHEVAAQMGVPARGCPDFVALHFSVAWPGPEVQAAAKLAFAGAALHGGSSSMGVMTERGPAIAGGRGMGGFAIWDPRGAYGSAMCPIGSDARGAARQATVAALAAAGRAGEAPDLVWLTAAPGREEDILRGIQDILGPDAPVVGGSAADNDVSGGWLQFNGAGLRGDGVVVSVLFPSRPIASSFESGYVPTHHRGRVTRVEGRTLYEIDGQPATEVYARWTRGAVRAPATGTVPILAQSTFYPLGREAGAVAGVPFHLLAHPARAGADGALHLFADVAPGEELWLMAGSSDRLVARAGLVAGQSLVELDAPHGLGHSGSLVVYCGGCMMAIQDRMEDVAQGIAGALGGRPFLGVFTFGEQGAPLGGASRHGNLMISCSSFG